MTWRSRFGLKPATRELKPSQDRLRLEFLPAAIELEQTPSNPWARAILWSIMGFFSLAVIWSVVGQVDVVAVAEGKLVPSGYSQVVQPAYLGRIGQIHVHDGDEVAAGDPLVTLDGTESRAQVEQLEEALSLRRRRLARLELWIEMLETGAQHEEGSLLAESSTLEPVLNSRVIALKNRDVMLRQRKLSRQADRARVEQTVRQLTRTLPLQREHAEAIRVLNERSMASRIEHLERQQAIINSEGQLAAERYRLEQLDAEIVELRHQRRQLWADALEDAYAEQEQLVSETEDLQQELIKANSRNNHQILSAPVAGTVHNRQVHTVGGIVQPAETIMEIIPAGEKVIAEVWVLNRDIGFVREGQDVSVKVMAFKFTRYGTLSGRVISVSRDAVVDEHNGARYRARVELGKDYMDVGEEKVNLSPGMQVTAEIITGRRRLIEFFAAPIMSALDEAGRER